MPFLTTAPYRVRHETRLRLAKVLTAERVTPKMMRITLGGDDLAGFVTGAYDDHVKLFFPEPGDELPVFTEGGARPTARDYTPRRYDAATNTLTIDFALHGEGPATSWAARARPGQSLGVGGPRGSLIVPDDLDWYLLAGDATALPAIGRRLEELPNSARAVVVVEVADPGEEQLFESRAQLETWWLHRDRAAPDAPSSALVEAVAALTFPTGVGYAWVAAEAAAAKALRRHLVEARGLAKDHVKAAAYWKRGDSAVHETYSD